MEGVNNTASEPTTALEALTQKISDQFEKSISRGLDKLRIDIKSSIAEQYKSLGPPDSIIDVASTLKQVASDMNKSINEAKAATSKISEMAFSYKEALVNTATQFTPPNLTKHQQMLPAANLGMLLGLDKKARQILLDTKKGEDNFLNIYEIKEKVAAALANLNPPPLARIEVQQVIKLRNGSMILQLKTKEAAEWLHNPTNEAAFTNKFNLDTCIREQVHPIMVPRIPITFDPSNPKHLREVEEINRLPEKTIKRARWIKPEYK